MLQLLCHMITATDGDKLYIIIRTSKNFAKRGGTEQMEKSTQEENAVLNTTLID